MRVGVIGSAQVGQTLASGLKKHGYDVRIVSRTPAKLAEFSSKSGIQAGPFAELAAWGEAVVLAVKGTVAEDAVREAGPANLAGKLVIDTTNPIANEPPDDGVLKFFTSPNESLMERLQAAFPDVKFVKALNSVGSALMLKPQFPGGAKPTMFYCRNDGAAKSGRRAHRRSVRVGRSRHGIGQIGPRDRAALPAMVHSWIQGERLDEPRIPHVEALGNDEGAASLNHVAKRSP